MEVISNVKKQAFDFCLLHLKFKILSENYTFNPFILHLVVFAYHIYKTFLFILT